MEHVLHYSVLVVTAERPTDRIIEEALRPFREEPDAEYLQDVDVTESARERFLAASGTMLLAPDGRRHDAFSEEFFREPTLAEDRVIMACRGMDGAIEGVRFQIKGWADGFLTAKVRIIPDGWQEVPNPRGHNQTFAEFASEYHCVPTVESEQAIHLDGDHSDGYVLVDEAGGVLRVVIRTNPNAHYDYWTRPGRFAGIMDHLGGTNVCRRADLRMEQTAAEHAGKRRAWADAMVAKFRLDGLAELHGHLLELAAEKAQWRKLKEKPTTFEGWLADRGMNLLAEMNTADGSIPDLRPHCTMEEWFGAARPLWAYAVVMDGVWHERERTPWWRDMVIDDERWEEDAWNIVSGIPGDRWITVVDCHN